MYLSLTLEYVAVVVSSYLSIHTTMAYKFIIIINIQQAATPELVTQVSATSEGVQRKEAVCFRLCHLIL